MHGLFQWAKDCHYPQTLKELWVINLDPKIDVGRLRTVSLTQGISHGGILVQGRVIKLF